MTGRGWSALAAVGIVATAIVLLLDSRDPGDKSGRAGGPVAKADRSMTPAAAPEARRAGARAQGELVDAPIDPDTTTPLDEKDRGTGTIALRFVDAVSGQPVPDLRFIVYSEKEGDHLLARGVSDAEGRALLGSFPAGTLLIQTERRPPHPATLDAVSLEEGESALHTVRLGRGGTFTGRVIDDRGEPVEGATISCYLTKYPLEEEATTARSPVDVTGPDGRYRVDHVLSTPRGVWIVDGELRPERWDPVMVWAEKDGVVVFSGGDVGEGDRKELPDLVLPRGGRLEGVVLRSDGTPAAGALVSAERSRFDEWQRPHPPAPGRPGLESSIPGAVGFTQRESEAIAGPGGEFEFLVRPEGSWDDLFWAVVVLPDLDHGFFAFPPVSSGETVKVQWRLEPAAVVRFRVKSKGSPGWVTNLDVRELDRRREEGGSSTRQTRGGGSSKLEALLRDGRGLSAEPFPMDEEWMARLEGAKASDVVELTLRLAFHRPSMLVTDRGLDEGPPLVFVVEPRVSWPLRLLVRLDGAEEGVVAQYIVTACLSPQPGRNSMDCCGLGASKHVEVPAGEGTAVDLVVEHEGPFWIKVWSGGSCLGSFGPFATGDQIHEVAIADPEAARPPAEAARVKEPPPPTRPGEGTPVMGRIHARLLDARTREMWKEEWPQEEVIAKPERGTMSAMFDGREHVFRAVAGSWTFRLRVHGYHPTDPFTVVVPPEGDVDLGEVLLEPLPRLRLRIVEHDGRPATSPNYIWVVAVPGPRDTLQLGSADEGRVEVPEPPPSPLVVVVQEYLSVRGLDSRAQAIEVEYSSLEEETTVRLRPWREATVTVHGIAPDHGDLPIGVIVRHDGTPPDGRYAGYYGGRALPSADATGMRTVRLELSPGTHRLEIESVLYSGEAEITVRDTGDVQSFDLWVERR